MRSIIYVGENTHDVELQDLKDQNGVAQTNATVNCTAVVDSDGAAMSGASVPISMQHIANGTYRGLIPHTVPFVVNQRYFVTIKATSIDGFRGEWREECKAVIRQE